ncbi:MAG: linear amide C-N hydrolase [Proteobacteria bacterium]|nr:linear amide C-N hydrolase [Pseudomonadota bacterium]
MNEAGLSIEFLWFTESKYQEAKNGDWLSVGDLSHWLLGNFATVDEVKTAFPRVKVVGVYVPQLGMVPGFHAAVHDARGNNIVVEFINGETKIYDNPIGVMTNKPTFDWHLTIANDNN